MRSRPEPFLFNKDVQRKRDRIRGSGHGLELWVIRHGECTANNTSMVLGQKDFPLSEDGRKQAHSLAKRLKDHIPFRSIYSSDLQRARETAEIINRTLKMRVNFHEGLRERGWGVFEGMTQKQIQIEFPDIIESCQKRGSFEPIPGAESDQEFLLRFTKIFQSITSSHSDGRIILITHSGWITLLYCFLTKHAPLSPPMNCSISRFILNKNRWRVI